MTYHGEPICLVTFNGVAVPVPQFTTTHSVDAPVGIATIVVPAHIDVANDADVEIQLGYAETGTSVVFRGTVTNVSWSFDANGKQRRVTCDGFLRRLNHDNDAELVYVGANSLFDIARSITDRRDIPTVHVDLITYLDGVTPIVLGGNDFVDDGDVVVQRRQKHLAWLQGTLGLFGYQIFERPQGDARIMRVGGLPSAATPWSITQGVDALKLDRTWSRYDRADYVDVTGARWTDADGIAVQIRSFPATVVEPDYVIASVRSDLLTTQALADLARNIVEINQGEPSDVQSYRTVGTPGIQPGDSVMVKGSGIDMPNAEPRWAMRVHHEFSERGFWTTVDCWAGAGVALGGGDDAITIPVATGPIHLGDETVPWYAAPTPSGKTYRTSFDVPSEYTAIVLEWLGHGSNSDFADGTSSELTVSQIVVLQDGEEVGKTDLPVLPEDYEKRLDYTNLSHWTRSRRPVPGRLKTGRADIEIRAGEIKNRGHVDDFEIRDITLTLTGQGRPTVPEVR